MKVVINKCYGGFGLSKAGMELYASFKGITLYIEDEDKFGGPTYWTVPADQRPKEINWNSATLEERQAYNKAYSASHIYDRDIERNDPALVKVVEQLGPKANGDYAELKVVEVPDDVVWDVEEYDGNEWIAETQRTWG
jgi:hypothetical protein